jgi:hypothetical protein
MFHYEVLSEQEAMQERFQLLKEGEYDAVITASIDAMSTNSGNPMMDMTATVYDDQGKPHSVRDFLVFTKGMMWKVVHFADSAGLLKEYQEQKLCSEVALNKRVRVKIAIEEGSEIPQDKLKGKALGSKYPDKNKVEDYIKKEDQKPLSENRGGVPFADDDIAF